MGELQLTHVFAGHTGDHHRRAGAQSHADPIHIRFTIREEREPGRTAGYATRPGEVGVIDRRFESVAAASVHRHHAHISYHGGKCHLLAGCGLADGAKRHRFGDAERIVGQASPTVTIPSDLSADTRRLLVTSEARVVSIVMLILAYSIRTASLGRRNNKTRQAEAQTGFAPR